MLDSGRVIEFLRERGLVDHSTAAGLDWRVRVVARRNRNLRVEGPGGGGFLLKQLHVPPGPGDPGLSHEAAFHRFCQEEPAVAGLSAFIPRLLHHEAGGDHLVFGLVPGAVPLGSSARTFEAAGWSVALGRALATLHTTFRRLGPERDPRLSWLERGTPWVMRAHQPSPEILGDLSPAGTRVLQILQADDRLCRTLEGLRVLWRAETVVHGDVKFDNVLVPSPPETGEVGVEANADAEPRVWLVDWEMVQLGDPAWDLAGALHQFLVYWTRSMPLSSGVEAGQMIARARLPLAGLRPSIHALWHGYRRASRLDPGEADDLLDRALTFSGAWLIHSACEFSSGAERLSPMSVILLQLGANVLKDPGLARVHLYGIPPGGLPR